MDFSEVLKRRTIRQFTQEPLKKEDLRAILNAARLASCASNKQRLRYLVATESSLVAKILPHTAYAALVQPHRDPVPGRTSPTAFIAVICNCEPGPLLHADAGAAIQSMEFAAWERGIGCCWIGSHQREKVAELLGLDHPGRILYLVALGCPAESPVCEDIEDGAVTNYYLDDKNTLHVPKLTVDAVTKWC